MAANWLEMTIREKYDELKAECGRHEYIYKYVGIPDPGNRGSWIKPPQNDPEHGGRIPMLRKFFIRPGDQKRAEAILAEGWEPFTPEPAPEYVKPAAKPEPETKTETVAEDKPKKTRTRSRKTKSTK